MISADSAPRNLPVPLLARYVRWNPVCVAFFWVVVEILAIRATLLMSLSAAIRSGAWGWERGVSA